ncbi:MAG: hypothetical protein M3O71_18470 [Bacteroidota bacterium]|nr:hypothetical protein [Bacteroidota bacterium]
MKSIIPLKFMLPVGLLLLAASFILKHFFILPDFVDGFLKGIGIGIIFISLIKQWYMKWENAK